MKKEKSCGCIIIENEKVLLIKDTNGNWGFPKGHVEEGETEKQTAIRETKEETNLSVEIVSDKRYINQYITDKNVDKTVIFFKAKLIGGTEKKQPEEIIDMKWVKLNEVKDNLTFDNLKVTIDEVFNDMKNNKC